MGPRHMRHCVGGHGRDPIDDAGYHAPSHLSHCQCPHTSNLVESRWPDQVWMRGVIQVASCPWSSLLLLLLLALAHAAAPIAASFAFVTPAGTYVRTSVHACVYYNQQPTQSRVFNHVSHGSSLVAAPSPSSKPRDHGILDLVLVEWRPGARGQQSPRLFARRGQAQGRPKTAPARPPSHDGTLTLYFKIVPACLPARRLSARAGSTTASICPSPSQVRRGVGWRGKKTGARTGSPVLPFVRSFPATPPADHMYRMAMCSFLITDAGIDRSRCVPIRRIPPPPPFAPASSALDNTWTQVSMWCRRRRRRVSCNPPTAQANEDRGGA